MKAIELSVIVPMFNEATRLRQTLSGILSYLQQHSPNCEVILVDDGSRDSTREVASQLLTHFSDMATRLLSLPINQGKGAAVRTGMLAAIGNVRVFADADNATPIEELERLLPMVQDDRTIVIASRALDRSLLEKKQPWWRDRLGRCFNVLMQLMTGLPFKDTQCGFKLFGQEAAYYCFSRQTMNRFSFDVELLYLAKKKGFKIIEVPCRWRHVEQSSVRPLQDGLRMAWDVMRLRWRHRGKT